MKHNFFELIPAPLGNLKLTIIKYCCNFRYVSSAYLNGYDYLNGECMMADWDTISGDLTTSCAGAATGGSMYSCPLMATQKRFPTGKLTIVLDFVDPVPTCSCYFGR